MERSLRARSIEPRISIRLLSGAKRRPSTDPADGLRCEQASAPSTAARYALKKESGGNS